MSIRESYMDFMYDRGSAETTVNSARKQMFTYKDRSFNAIPLTSAALLQHAKYTSVAMYGVRPMSEIQISLLQSHGDGAT
ncbi:hypothetical protein Pmani_026328 [Petrolisthes manimaculis]|uniref:Uncharacterized protein n=1 Tax=Petrolisthes manimaculis TaxID=1843537 RepID=A0AAE1U080_9EUCA|nr:hypothetical protein Pmani_026328 [Petrolisthes manimaculis]